jgi:hypothetical protein
MAVPADQGFDLTVIRGEAQRSIPIPDSAFDQRR